MGRIEEKFVALKKEGKKAFIAYITAGDPDLRTTGMLIPALERAGVDIIEIGVPFSDPVADGPIIQAASERALKKGIKLDDIFKMIATVRKKSRLPIVLFGYYNPVLHYGNAAFAAAAGASGVDGILVVDLPPEEADELRRYTDPAGLSFITLIAPTTGLARIRKMVGRASGFLYYISVTGVTGTAKPVLEDIRNDMKNLRTITSLPTVVGFGISTPEQAASIAALADGVVVGSALVKLIGANGKSNELLPDIASFAAGIRQALDAAPLNQADFPVNGEKRSSGKKKS
ncbi:MAG: tryptophan synthase subunit alpha [Syntrophales bacterium]|jgi:tryptophan synthase alpha chain|nr:tryptophan synthase subunit alpha [Syntrophales bacterium]